MQNKIKKFFWKIFKKQKNKQKEFKKNFQLLLIILVILIWAFSVKTVDIAQIKDISAKIFVENFWNNLEKKEEVKNLNLSEFLEKIKSWDEKNIKELQKIYWIDFPIFWEILDERVTQVWNLIHFYFEATVWDWDSVHEFEYDWKNIDWEIQDLFESE